MNYLETLQISSTYPCLIVYMLDQSGSMEYPFANEGSKAQKVADSVNEIICETGVKCYDSNGTIKNRFELSVIGYGAIRNGIEPAWEGNLRDNWVVSIEEVFNNPIGEVNGIPVWVTPKAVGQTPMAEAFENVYRICEAWINWGNHRDCHPPIVINITDGEATDGGMNQQRLIQAVNNLKSLHTNYGGVNIFNIHISGSDGDSILFPSSMQNWNNYAQLLFDLSTPLNDDMIKNARAMNYDVKQGAKGYVFNGNAKHLMDFLNIGSQLV